MYLSIKNSKGYALFLAILPVIMMYQIPGIGMGASTVLIAIGMLYAGIVLIKNVSHFNIYMILPSVIYFGYCMTKSSALNILLCVAIIVHLGAISCGAVNLDYLRKIIEVISVVAAICVVMQFLIHTVSGVHIQMINMNWCLNEMEQYRSNITTGISQSESLYRPSAFFLEPSHMAKYCVIGIISCLFKEKSDYKKALAISMGIIFTTSGMGILLVIAIWFIFPFISSKGLDMKKTKRIIIIVICFIIGLLILSKMSFFQEALSRITGTVEYSSNQYNAIWGRTLYWDTYITPLRGKELLFGLGTKALPGVYFTGLMELVYCYGIFGTVLFYIMMISCMRLVGTQPKLIAAMFAILMIIANLTGFISIIFYLGVIYSWALYNHEMNSKISISEVKNDEIDYCI